MNSSHRPATDGALNDFEIFFRSHYDFVTKYVERRAFPSQVDDVVSATFFVAWKKFGDHGNRTLPWLLQIAKYEIANKRRSERTRQNHLTLVDLRNFTEASDSDYDGDEVLHALSNLSTSDQEILRLVHWDRLSREDVAKTLSISISTANVRYHRALRRLESFMPPSKISRDTTNDSDAVPTVFLKEITS